jgi:hypothetical protein
MVFFIIFIFKLFNHKKLSNFAKRKIGAIKPHFVVFSSILSIKETQHKKKLNGVQLLLRFEKAPFSAISNWDPTLL